MNEVIAVRPAVDLAQLASRINDEHAAAIAAFGVGVDRARSCGLLLNEAKRLCRHGEWLPWLAKNCPAVGVRQAQKYMRLAAKWAELASANANPDSHSTIDKALATLAESAPADVVKAEDEVCRRLDEVLILLKGAAEATEAGTPDQIPLSADQDDVCRKLKEAVAILKGVTEAGIPRETALPVLQKIVRMAKEATGVATQITVDSTTEMGVALRESAALGVVPQDSAAGTGERPPALQSNSTLPVPSKRDQVKSKEPMSEEEFNRRVGLIELNAVTQMIDPNNKKLLFDLRQWVESHLSGG